MKSVRVDEKLKDVKEAGGNERVGERGRRGE